MKRIFVFTILSVAFTFAHSQQILTLKDCRKLALDYNKEISASIAGTRSANSLLKSMKANYFPDFSLEGLAAYSTMKGSLMIPGGNLPLFLFDANGQMSPVNGFAYFPDMDIKYDMDMVYMGGIRLKQPIYMGGKIRSAHKMASIGVDIARLNEYKTKSDIVYETDCAYIQVVKVQEMKKVAQRYNSLLKELLSNVENAHRLGLKPLNDVLKVKVRYNDSKLSLKKAENSFKLAKMNLCHYIGKPLIEDIAVSQGFDDNYNILYSETIDITMRPEYKMMEKQVEAMKQQIKMDRSNLLPNISLLGDYSYSHGIDVNNSPFLDGASFSALLNVSIPVFHFGERKNKVNSSKAKLEQLRFQFESLNEKMYLELTQALNNIEEADLECELSEESLKQAEENMNVSRKQYDLGLEPLSDYLESQLLWQQAYEKCIESYTMRFLHKVNYQKVSGTLLSE